MSDGLTTTILGLLIVLSGIGAGVYFWINRPAAATHDEETGRIQPLFGSEQAKALDIDSDDEPVVMAPPVVRAPVPPVTHAPPAHASAAHAATAHAPAARAPMQTPPRPVMATSATAPAHGAVNASARTAIAPDPVAGNGQHAAAGGTAIRFSIPTDGTLQFLPGRLEVVGGSERGREIRFVRQPSFDAPTVTFGRSEGEAYRHVQLVDPTVSRQHARMRLGDAGWYLMNLSTTNPVAYNGEIMGENAEMLLADGDRIEMGEVVFRFRAR